MKKNSPKATLIRAKAVAVKLTAYRDMLAEEHGDGQGSALARMAQRVPMLAVRCSTSKEMIQAWLVGQSS